MLQERRQSQRFHDEQVVFVTLTNGGRESTAGVTENVSADGTLLYCDRFIALGSQVEVMLEFVPEITLGKPVPALCQGRVLRIEQELKEGKFGMAVVFEQLHVLPSA